MKHTNIFTLLLFLSISLFLLANAKISPRVELILSSSKQRSEGEKLNLWIYFKDKGHLKNERREQIISQLHPNTLKRRQKMEKEGMNINNQINNYDVPVNTQYIQQVKDSVTGIKVRHSSKWLNAVS